MLPFYKVFELEMSETEGHPLKGIKMVLEHSRDVSVVLICLLVSGISSPKILSITKASFQNTNYEIRIWNCSIRIFN